MSENHDKKKVIYVKDLVIKADNVVIEPQRHEGHDRVDPFFGGPRRRNEAEESSSSHNNDESNNNNRGGFSWI
ncbi:hypothetical protein Q7A53_07490 [Halobacillus rhizosphaerae]|uniref:hypothetical protein n=1 Tax=Halobacillus rhizosphaerae TaxID=3064889 RepID=UPI00398B86F4